MISFPNSLRLADRLAEYVLVRAIASNSAYQLSRTISLFGEFLKAEPTVQDLTPETVNNFLASLALTHSPRTVAGHRINLLGIWRFLAECGACEAPRQIRHCRKPDPMPVAWTLDELRTLLAAAEKAVGTMEDGTAKSVYWSAIIRVAYDSALRRSDLWLIRQDQIRSDGTIVLRQHKTGFAHHPRLSPKALALIRQIMHDPPLAWQTSNIRQFYTEWKRLVRAAGIRPGCLQQIRRTAATWLAKEHPDQVQRFLGHRSESMKRHYVDLSIARPLANLPPEL